MEHNKAVLEKKMYSREEVLKLKDLADAIINPACDILPDTYNDDLANYFDWVEENLQKGNIPKPTINRTELPSIIVTILDHLNDLTESIHSDEELKNYVEDWVEKNL